MKKIFPKHRWWLLSALCFAIAISVAYGSTFPVARAAETPEFRGLWFEDTEKSRTQSDWDALMNDIKNRGFTDVFANFTYAGGAYYRSNYLPAWWIFDGTNDQLRMFIDAAHRNGLKAHDWIIAYNARYGITSAEKTKLRAAGGLALLWDRNTQKLLETADNYGQSMTWLNYNNPLIRDRLVNIATEIATSYSDLDGIHFDYVRSPGDISSYDEQSRLQFTADTDVTINAADWPGVVMPGYLFKPAREDGKFRQQYIDWQATNITNTMRLIKEAVKTIRPNMKISAAVLPTKETPHLMAQDWALWAEKGYVDFLAPMDYTTDTGAFATMVDQDLKTASGYKPVYPGISFAGTGLTTANGLEMISTVRKKGNGGFMLYRHEAIATRKDLPPNFAPTTSSAPNACRLGYPAGSEAPSDYGISWNFSASSELLLTAICNGPNAQLTIGSADTNNYAYLNGYVWNGTAWQVFTLTGNTSNAKSPRASAAAVCIARKVIPCVRPPLAACNTPSRTTISRAIAVARNYCTQQTASP